MFQRVFNKIIGFYKLSSNMSLPLIVILGSTGSGKTKLSLELAQKFSSEIIGADSMQVYKGLDIITAKATKDEQNLATHHLIDVLSPTEEFTVVDYRDRALNIIDRLLSENKIPIIVGGTNYYIESILWKILISEPGSVKTNKPGIMPNNDHELSNEVLHKKLQDLDPVMARRLHPNDKRKVLRSLEVLYRNGKRHSDLLAEQQTSEGGSSTGGALRYPNTIIFWLQCNQNNLDERLNKRVDLMIEDGLLNELESFHTQYNANRIKNEIEPDYTKGIFQAIGFKEFHKYLLLSPEERKNPEGEKLFSTGVADLKMVTRRYARKQTRWIVNRFLARTDRQVPPVYGLSTDDINKFDENVTNAAIEIIESCLSGTPSKYNPLPKRINVKTFPNSTADTNRCEICNRIFVGEHQWAAHKKSSKHKRMAMKKKKEGEVAK
ncbi:tRNA dimethylallyltransferase [Onthophagus taurus]|uniref:tRNA dimethylallyltransferase n=1 Tax=Onthophagus taurus TaxID=166361 RepID=UPI0039BE8622